MSFIFDNVFLLISSVRGSGDRREVSLTLKTPNRYEQNDPRQTNYQKTFRPSPIPGTVDSLGDVCRPHAWRSARNDGPEADG